MRDSTPRDHRYPAGSIDPYEGRWRRWPLHPHRDALWDDGKRLCAKWLAQTRSRRGWVLHTIGKEFNSTWMWEYRAIRSSLHIHLVRREYCMRVFWNDFSEKGFHVNIFWVLFERRVFNPTHEKKRTCHTTWSSDSGITASSGRITIPKANLWGSHFTSNRKCSTSSDGRFRSPNFDRRWSSAKTFAFAERCGVWALDIGEEEDWDLTIDIVSVPPNRDKLVSERRWLGGGGCRR